MPKGCIPLLTMVEYGSWLEIYILTIGACKMSENTFDNNGGENTAENTPTILPIEYTVESLANCSPNSLPFIADIDFSLNIQLVVELNGLKKQFNQWQVYPCDKVIKLESGWQIEINKASFEVGEDDVEFYFREESEPKKKIHNRGGSIPDQNKEYMKKTNRDLSMDILDNVIETFDDTPANTFSDKVQKFLTNKSNELRKYFIDGKNMNPKVLFDGFVNAGGIFIENENGEIEALPFWKQRSLLPKNYYRKLGLKLEFENPHETNPVGKFIPQKFKWAKFGNMTFKVYSK